MNEEIAATGTTTNDAGEAGTTDATNETTLLAGDATATETEATEAVVPESYEFTMPEGVELDKAAADEFSAIAKELKLDQATAQKVADVGAKMAQRQAEVHAKTVESWVESVKADKEIGGDSLDANLGVARKALDMFGSDELKEVLNSTGFGNHPAVIKAFYKIGKATGDDGFVTGAAKGADTDPAKRMFPNMN